MKKLKIILFPALFVLIATTFLLSSAGVQAQANTSRKTAISQTQCGKWSVVSSPNITTGDSNLGAVAALSTNDVWAVGNQVDANTSIARTLIEHWDGTAWKIVNSPNVGPFGNTLYGVAVASANKAWAVGYAIGNNHIAQTLIEQWNGQSWSVVDSPNPGDTYNQLYGITAITPDDAWAVGYDQNAGRFQPLTEHWNGKDWQVVASPNPGPSDNLLYGVKAVSANNIWAVGQHLNPSGVDEPLVEHWDGTSWSVVSHPNTGTSSALLGVAAVSDNVWAVGQVAGSNAPTRPLAVQKDDTTWTIATPPHAATFDNQLLAVAAANDDDIWAAGTYVDSSGSADTLIEHSDGQNWKVVSSPNPGGTGGNNILGGIAAVSPHDVWAVGGFDTGNNTMTLVEHYC